MKIFNEALVEKAAAACHVADLSRATIGEVLLVAQYLEKETGIPFIRMDQGSPGLPVNHYGVEAEKAALDRGVGSQYPAAAGVPELKDEASRFVKAFLNDLKIANLARDEQLLQYVREVAREVLATDPERNNPQNKVLWERLRLIKDMKNWNWGAIS